MTSTARRLAPLLVLGLIAASCSRGGPSPLELGVRAVALDLAFQDEELAIPIEPERIIRIIPAPPEVRVPADLVQFETPPPSAEPPPPQIPNFFGDCPEAPPDAAPEKPATVGQKEPPAVGRYARHNTGTFNIQGGIVDLTLPYPFVTADEVTDVREIAPPGPFDGVTGIVGPNDPEDAEDTGLFEWTTTTFLTPEISVSFRYRLTAAAIQIVERISRNGEGETSIRPSPPVDLIQLNQGPGHTWRSAGVDNASSTAFQIEGLVESREPIDACGTLIDTYRVVTTETLVNLTNGAVTTNNEPSRYNIATQYGGLIVETEQHYTENSRDPDSGAPISLTFDYVSTLDKISPEPLQ